jgi:peptide/nickel transport system substrate-binding protein
MGNPNTNFITNQRLFDTTMRMRNTAFGDNATYYSHWLDFVIYFNEILVDLPMYSDNWHTFFTPSLKNFYHDSMYPWHSAIIRSWLD